MSLPGNTIPSFRATALAAGSLFFYFQPIQDNVLQILLYGQDSRRVP
jgi:hypothetical protein